MLIGLNPTSSSPASQPNAGPAADYIFEATLQNFEQRVMAESMKRPVIVEFWAPWCAPCKQLMPMLERVVTAHSGQIAMAKVNIDQVPELAQAFRVQSVPMVVVLFMGQPVTGFAGVRPQADLEQLCKQLIEMKNKHAPHGDDGDTPDHLNIPLILAEAKTALASNDLGRAQSLYAMILSQENEHPEAYIGLTRVMIAAGQFDGAAGMVEHAPALVIKSPDFASLKTAVELAGTAAEKAGKLTELERNVAQSPADCAARFDLAEGYYAQNMKDRAVDELIAILRIDRNWGEEKARTQLLKYFESWGFQDQASIQGRRKLSAILFS